MTNRKNQEYYTKSITLAAGAEFQLYKDGISSFSIVTTSPGATLQIAEIVEGRQCTFAFCPFGFNVNFTTPRGIALRNPGTTQSTYTVAFSEAPLGGAAFSSQDGQNPSMSLATTQTTGVVVDSTSGVLNANLYDGQVSTWFDASAYVGKYCEVLIVASAGLVGGNIAFEQSGDAILDPSGGSWNLQDITSGSDSQGASLTTAAATVYRRGGLVTSPLIRQRLTSAITAGNIQIKYIFGNTGYLTQVNTRSATGSANNVQATGPAAHSSPASGNPLRGAAKAKSTTDTTLVDNDTSDLIADPSNGGLVQKPFGPSPLDWTYPAAAGGIVSSIADVQIAAARTAGIRNFLTGGQLSWDALGAATEFVIKDGATVIWRHKIAAGVADKMPVELNTPLRGTAATAMNIALTVSTTGGVYFNGQGYQAAG